MDYPIEVTLKRPITVDGKVHEKLFFDEPTIGAQIDYAELEAELGIAKLRAAVEAEKDPVAREEIIPAHVSMQVSLFWVEALSGLPKGAGRLIKSSDQGAVHAAVDAILDGSAVDDQAAESAGNATPAK